MAGIERLVQYRGYRQNETLLGRSLFKNICYASVGQLPICFIYSLTGIM